MSSRKVQAHGALAFQIALKALELYLRRCLLLTGSLRGCARKSSSSLAGEHALFAGGTHAHRDFRARPHDDSIFGRETSASASRSGPGASSSELTKHVTQKRLKPRTCSGVIKRIEQTRLVARNEGRALPATSTDAVPVHLLGKEASKCFCASNFARQSYTCLLNKLLQRNLKVLRGANLCGEVAR